MKKMILYTIAYIRRVDFYKIGFITLCFALCHYGNTIEAVLLLIVWVLQDIVFELKKLNSKKQ